MQAALIADTLGKRAERDVLLQKIVDANPGQNLHGVGNAGLYKRLAELMRKLLPPGSLHDFGFDKVDAVVSASPKDEAPVNLQYFVGIFLKNRGDAKKSREYLVRCAQSPLYIKYTHVLALQLLRDLKIPIPTPPAAERAELKK
jgi:hypothetical protein